VGLGSNLGDPFAHLERARTELAALPLIRLAAVSNIYWTEPQDYAAQPWFANQVARLECAPELTAQSLLISLQQIERALGRARADLSRAGEGPVLRFGPRAIDLDLLLFGDEPLATPSLTVPHPRLYARAFALVPLREVAPGLVFPDKKSLDEVLEKVSFRVESDRIWQSVPLAQPEKE
jgi:2-amino-4-hydroxy-6-hydroxymethyldihydropteridine diphosphokinase